MSVETLKSVHVVWVVGRELIILQVTGSWARAWERGYVTLFRVTCVTLPVTQLCHILYPVTNIIFIATTCRRIQTIPVMLLHITFSLNKSIKCSNFLYTNQNHCSLVYYSESKPASYPSLHVRSVKVPQAT